MSSGTTRGLSDSLTQERIVLALSVALFAAFGLFAPGFLTASNTLSLIQNVAILGLLGIGMSVTIIGRGIDLSIVAIMAISVAWSLSLFESGMGVAPAILLGFAFALLIGVINGVLIAYVEIPAIFTTLAMGTVVYGFGQYFLVPIDVTYVNESIGWIHQIGAGRTLGIPNSVISLAVIAALGFFALRSTIFGRYLYAMGDNPASARVAGVPTRPLIVAKYVLSALVAFVAGVVMAMSVDSMNTRIVNSTIVYDVILVAVIGGISLSGGKGGILNVLVGTLLIGILLNGMTILNMPYTAQNIVKGLILLFAIVADSIFNPRDEQTSQQGDI
ncbi:MAG: ABC transporter permease [Mesorhizobium sp.]|nr:ABC transporter permease [Mesorhizobium sp.]MCO5164114.1 ABC transporter permease [Mesorhizobium sp.]